MLVNLLASSLNGLRKGPKIWTHPSSRSKNRLIRKRDKDCGSERDSLRGDGGKVKEVFPTPVYSRRSCQSQHIRPIVFTGFVTPGVTCPKVRGQVKIVYLPRMDARM